MSFFQENDAFFSAFLCGKWYGQNHENARPPAGNRAKQSVSAHRCAGVGTLSVRLSSECGADWPKRESTSFCSRDEPRMRARRRDGNPYSDETRGRRRDGNPNSDETRTRRTDGIPDGRRAAAWRDGDPDEPSLYGAGAGCAGVSISAAPEDADRSRPRPSRNRSSTSLHSTAHNRRKSSCNRNPGSPRSSRQSFPGSW